MKKYHAAVYIKSMCQMHMYISNWTESGYDFNFRLNVVDD